MRRTGPQRNARRTGPPANFRVETEDLLWGAIGVTLRAGKRKIGEFIAEKRRGGHQLVVRRAVMRPGYERRGLGTKGYEALARWAHDNGFTLVSDHSLTDSSRGFWEKQVSRGRARWDAEDHRFVLTAQTEDLANNIARALKRNGSTLEPVDATLLTEKLLAEFGIHGYRVGFSNRQTRAFGLTNFKERTITYAMPLWPRANATDRRQVIAHEVAHAIVEAKYGRKAGVSHGRPWKSWMHRLGYPEASPYHTLNRAGIARARRDTIEIACCGAPIGRVTMKRYVTLARRGVCKRCGGRPSISNAADLARFESWLATQ